MLPIVGHDERQHTIAEAFLEQHHATDAAVAVLERMNALETVMEIHYILEGARAAFVAPDEQRQLSGNLLGKRRHKAAHLVGQHLEDARGKNGIGGRLLGALLQHLLEGQEQFRGKRFLRRVQHGIEQTEVVRCILDVRKAGVTVDGPCLEYLPGLLLGQA